MPEREDELRGRLLVHSWTLISKAPDIWPFPRHFWVAPRTLSFLKRKSSQSSHRRLRPHSSFLLLGSVRLGRPASPFVYACSEELHLTSSSLVVGALDPPCALLRVFAFPTGKVSTPQETHLRLRWVSFLTVPSSLSSVQAATLVVPPPLSYGRDVDRLGSLIEQLGEP